MPKIRRRRYPSDKDETWEGFDEEELGEDFEGEEDEYIAHIVRWRPTSDEHKSDYLIPWNLGFWLRLRIWLRRILVGRPVPIPLIEVTEKYEQKKTSFEGSQQREFDKNYEMNYNPAVERETKPFIASRPIADNTDALLDLSDFYTTLSSLVAIRDPEPDYMGIGDERVLMQSLEETLQKLPEGQRPLFVEDATIIKALIDKKLFQAARELILQRSEEVSKLLSDGREPPPDVKAYLQTLPAVE